MALLAAIVHLWWGLLLLLIGPSALDTTPLHTLAFMPAKLAGILLICIAGLALWGHRKKSFLWFLPQQFVLTMATASIIVLIGKGQYADGAVYPWHFIAADQAWGVVVAILHTVELAGRSKMLRNTL